MPPQSRNAPIKPTEKPLVLNGAPLEIHDVFACAVGGRKVVVSPAARKRMQITRAVVETALGDGLPHYGINTGFGSLARKRIEGNDVRELQKNLVRSHAAGVGDAFDVQTVRAMMLLLAASLCRGLSGVRPQVPDRIVDFLNLNITPVVPHLGSVGASGDLAPLAHVALALIGEGTVSMGRRTMSAARACAACRIAPLQLEAKEGLALINGTHLMAARAALACQEVDHIMAAATTAAAMSIDACRGTDSFLLDAVHEARKQPGQRLVASRMRDLLHGSTVIPSHRENDPRVQDPYSLRCTPPVLGAAWDSLVHARACVERELEAVTDNPLVFADRAGEEAIVSAGNFHGMPLAIPLDLIAICLAHVAGISERRTFFMLSASDPEAQLTAYLSPKPGLHSGLMIVQYTAAACCNELIGLANPASVANIPTSAGTEDYNSFGPRSAAKALRAAELARYVVAAEMLCAAQGIEAHRPLKSGRLIEQAISSIRAVVPSLTKDRPPAPDLNAISMLIKAGAFGEATRQLH